MKKYTIKEALAEGFDCGYINPYYQNAKEKICFSEVAKLSVSTDGKYLKNGMYISLCKEDYLSQIDANWIQLNEEHDDFAGYIFDNSPKDIWDECAYKVNEWLKNNPYKRLIHVGYLVKDES